MAQEEMLSYLVLGRSLSNTGAPTPAEQQALALGAALKLTGRTGFFEKLGSQLGMEGFALSTEGDSSDTKVAISGNLSKKLFISFGIGLFDQSQSVKLRYRLSPKLSLEALTSLESAVTLFYTFRR
jgi:translocation and assembly module TamB